MGSTKRRAGKKRLRNKLPDWLTKALKIFKPPENLTVSEWADKYRILDAKTSAEPGPWTTLRTPYLKGIMDAFTDPDIEEIIFVKPTQVGGTETINNMVGYVIAQDPSPTLVVLPTLDLAESISKNRIQPMITLSQVIRDKYQEGDSKLLELQFEGMYIALSGANSPASLSSKPMRYLFMDEVDKYPVSSGKEADPRKLAKERTHTFTYNKKIVQTSTPTKKHGPIWKEWENADDQRKYYVPCPHCGHKQTLRFKQIKWPKTAKKPEEVQYTAHYECERCGGFIADGHKPGMLRAGEWISEKGPYTRTTAFHINSLYSPWVRFGDVAAEFIKSKDSPELLMNFVNSWLAEPWENTEVKTNPDKVLERQSEYEEGVVPDGALILTGGVDVQKDYFIWTIRAWGVSMTSWNIGHGRADSWDDVELIMNLPYLNKQGSQFQVNLCGVDSGDQTEEVYDFCAVNQEWAVPVKGSSTPLLARYKITTIEKTDSKALGLRLYLVDGGQYKDMIAGRMNRPNGTGSWMVYQGCDREYADQICAEEKVIEKRNGREVDVWRPKSTHVANHYLDAEVYCALAADLLHVRYLNVPQEGNKPGPPNPESQSDVGKPEGSWLQNKGGWIR